MSVEILSFTIQHLDECAQLAVEVFNGEPGNQHWTVETARIRLLEIFNTPGFVGFVWRTEEMLGFAVGNCEQWQDAKRFELKTICVRCDRQDQGIGTKLLQHLATTLSTMNVNSIHLLSARDGQAEEFYKKNGFQRSQQVILRKVI